MVESIRRAFHKQDKTIIAKSKCFYLEIIIPYLKNIDILNVGSKKINDKCNFFCNQGYTL